MNKTEQTLCGRGVPAGDERRLIAFAERFYAEPASGLRLYTVPLGGGLSALTSRVTVRFLDTARRPRTAAFVVKRAHGREVRELDAYRKLLRGKTAGYSPRLLHHETAAGQTAYLYLEWIQPWRSWPWQDKPRVDLVLEGLALAHSSLRREALGAALQSWDYESALAQSAADTREFFEICSRLEELRGIRAVTTALRRVVGSLGRIRRQLMETSVVIHGDAHPGNVLLRRRGRRIEPVFLDWARVRLGSPMEDVSSWLQSLGYWEPEARRRHDTLLKRYLEARGSASALSASVREHYWLAGASNALAGAMKYYLVQAVSEENPEWLRDQAVGQVRHWARLIARADACWRN